MNNMNKTNTITTLIALTLLVISANLNAAPVGTGFNYQGELIQNGVAVDTPKVFTFSLYDASTGGNQVGPTITRGGVLPPFIINEQGIAVNNGLFNVANLDFGPVYTGDEVWLEITVKVPRPALCGPLPLPPCPVAEVLTPRQKIQATPYAVQADYLGPIGASNGDVLQFDGSDWVPSAGVATPWNLDGQGQISYSNGKVVINNSTELNGDVRQPIANNGLMKYMVAVNCGSGSSVIRQYNGVNLGTITATGANVGRCIIDFPTDIDDRFWQVSINYASPTGLSPRTASCRLETASTDSLFCNINRIDTGATTIGTIMVLVY